MNRTIARLILFGLTFGSPPAATVLAQIAMQPTPPPAVVADNEAWYLDAGPIAFGGNVYYPSGPVIHFLRNEMMLSGIFERVPIYIRTTLEPGSLVYVPLAGGLMRPYERRREGDLAGTVGSTVPAFPIVLRSAEPQRPATPAVGAAYPHTDTARSLLGAADDGWQGAAPLSEWSRPGTAGAMLAEPVPLPFQTLRRPLGLNGVFVVLDNARWFAAGPAVEIRAGAFVEAGGYHGFPVYVSPETPGVIYVASVTGPPGLLSPYRQR